MTREHDPYADLIASNQETVHRMYEQAVRLVRKHLEAGLADKSGMKYRLENECVLALRILDALAVFHPMHGESWAGWPEGA